MSYSDAGNEAVVWSTSGGGVLARRVNMAPFALSSDGQVVVGDWRSPEGSEACAWRWGSAEFIRLGDFPGYFFSSTAHGVSDDGRIIAGSGSPPPGPYPDGFRWTSRCGLVPLGLNHTYVSAISGTGSVIVGWALYDGADHEPFIWDTVRGSRKLTDVFAALDVPLGDYLPLRITGVSADGQTICGVARQPNGVNDAPFIARIPFRCNVADVNLDGSVDITDLAELLARFGSCCGELNYLLADDLTGEGCIDLDDLTSILAEFGTFCH